MSRLSGSCGRQKSSDSGMRMSGASTPGVSANGLWVGAPLHAVGLVLASTFLVLLDSMMNAALWAVADSLGPAGCGMSTLNFAS